MIAALQRQLNPMKCVEQLRVLHTPREPGLAGSLVRLGSQV